jgi:hypothetical protein
VVYDLHAPLRARESQLNQLRRQTTAAPAACLDQSRVLPEGDGRKVVVGSLMADLEMKTLQEAGECICSHLVSAATSSACLLAAESIFVRQLLASIQTTQIPPAAAACARHGAALRALSLSRPFA